jgi:uncharacterized coiled-coil protein SlyX
MPAAKKTDAPGRCHNLETKIMKTGTTSSRLTKAITPVRNSLNRSPLRGGLPGKQQLPSTQPMWIIRGFLLIPLVLASFALAPQARADCLQGCDAFGNTFLGDDALLSDGGYRNTAIGIQTLWNVFADNNTATGAYALHDAWDGGDNTATGAYALYSNGYGSDNTAIGVNALYRNTDGSFNTASGSAALYSNTTGIWNTATGGWGALYSNIDGSFNTAEGLQALFSNTSGSENTASGLNALFSNTTGSRNIALGAGAGGALTTGSDNIDIGTSGVAGESAKIRIGTIGAHKNTYIAGIYGATTARGVTVFVDSTGHLGTPTSSKRFKDQIKPMDKASEAILALKPVTFRYKHELDPEGIPQFGLVAEQVEKVNPDLVARDDQGKPYTVRYEAVNAMLLNEFLKQHHKVKELEATTVQQGNDFRSAIAQQRKDFESTVAQQQKEIKTLTASLKEQASQIQKVSAQLEMKKTAPQMVDNNQ